MPTESVALIIIVAFFVVSIVVVRVHSRVKSSSAGDPGLDEHDAAACSDAYGDAARAGAYTWDTYAGDTYAGDTYAGDAGRTCVETPSPTLEHRLFIIVSLLAPVPVSCLPVP